MEIPTVFPGIPIEIVGISEPLGMIPNGMHGIPWEIRLIVLSKIVIAARIQHLTP